MAAKVSGIESVPQATPIAPCEAPCCGGSPREGACSELASAAATGGGGRHAPPTQRPEGKTTVELPRTGIQGAIRIDVMDFGLSDEQKMIVGVTREFVRKELLPL